MNAHEEYDRLPFRPLPRHETVRGQGWSDGRRIIGRRNMKFMFWLASRADKPIDQTFGRAAEQVKRNMLEWKRLQLRDRALHFNAGQ